MLIGIISLTVFIIVVTLIAFVTAFVLIFVTSLIPKEKFKIKKESSKDQKEDDEQSQQSQMQSQFIKGEEVDVDDEWYSQPQIFMLQKSSEMMVNDVIDDNEFDPDNKNLINFLTNIKVNPGHHSVCLQEIKRQLKNNKKLLCQITDKSCIFRISKLEWLEHLISNVKYDDTFDIGKTPWIFFNLFCFRLFYGFSTTLELQDFNNLITHFGKHFESLTKKLKEINTKNGDKLFKKLDETEQIDKLTKSVKLMNDLCSRCKEFYTKNNNNRNQIAKAAIIKMILLYYALKAEEFMKQDDNQNLVNANKLVEVITKQLDYLSQMPLVDFAQLDVDFEAMKQQDTLIATTGYSAKNKMHKKMEVQFNSYLSGTLLLESQKFHKFDITFEQDFTKVEIITYSVKYDVQDQLQFKDNQSYFLCLNNVSGNLSKDPSAQKQEVWSSIGKQT